MKILVADKISAAGVEFLRNQSELEVVEAYGSTPEQVLELVSDADAIIVRSETKVTAQVFEAAQKLKVVARAGVGVDNIDVDAATQRGVVVMNTPSGNTNATAELAFTHMLCATRPVPQANASMSTGKWDRSKFSGSELSGKTLGVLGLGRIGSEVAKRAQAFGMKVLAYDPYLTPERGEAMKVEPVTLDDLFSRADYITVHMPLTDHTKDMLNKAAFEKMKQGVRIINCARGGIVNEGDLAEALESGKVAAAGLDVYEDEPLAEDSKLRKIPNLVLTPHLGASTKEAQVSVGIEAAEGVYDVLSKGLVRNAVNMPSVDLSTLKQLRPYLELGEKLGYVLQNLITGAIVKVKITYWGKVAELDTMPLTRSIQRGYLRNISGENVNDVNAPHFMKRLGIEVEVVNSGTESDYLELVRVDATERSGKNWCIAGTLIGTAHDPRIVHINGYDVESSLKGSLLFLKNNDIPGIVGMVGTVLGKHGINIAGMSLSRNEIGETALTVLQLDAPPGKNALQEIVDHEAIRNVYLVTV